ncbi:MAG: class I SAM-dependent methyltransferase [Candidatus Binatia bacterium]
MATLLSSCSVLQEIFSTKTSTGPAGESIPINSNISRAHAEALFSAVLNARPSLVIEIGMAFGVSTLAILAALHQLGHGRLISIDPFQSTQWTGRGLAAVGRAGFAARHQLIEDFDYTALPRLLQSSHEIDFAYIDGWHTFDYALLDSWYLDKMLKAGGILGFNDCGLPAVDKVIKFLLRYRRYQEVDVGLASGAGKYSRLRNLMRQLRGKKPLTYNKPDRYFKKAESWEPNWDYFAEF